MPTFRENIEKKSKHGWLIKFTNMSDVTIHSLDSMLEDQVGEKLNPIMHSIDYLTKQ